MSKIADLVQRIRATTDEQAGTPDRAKVAELAQQFESMLMVQMLRDMRESGKWDSNDDPESGGLGADAFFESMDVELASYLSKARGFGLAQELQSAIEKTAGVNTPAASAISSVGRALTPVATSAAPKAVAPAETPVGTTGTVEAAGAGLRFQVEPGSITSSFGWRRDPFTGQAKFHRGIDVRAAYGQDIQAAGDGRVVVSGEQRGYGNTVVVEHANGVQTRYAHLSARVVQVGDTVRAGSVVGQAGKSGRATGTHLHFEVIKDGRQVSPAEAGLSTQAVAGASD